MFVRRLAIPAADLTRTNVLSTDPVNTGFSVAVGEQRSRGLEMELTQDLGNGLSVSGAYAYIASEVTGGSWSRRIDDTNHPTYVAEM